MDKKLAKKKAKEEMLIRMRKETLERERAMDEATLRKIKDKWFDSIVETKVPQMQDNLRYIMHYMEKLIEAESYRKSLFENEREDLEEESRLLAQSHGSALERLYDIYQKRIQDMNNAYSEMVSNKKQHAEEAFNKIEEKEHQRQEDMQTMLYQMNGERDKEEDTMNCSMFLRLDDERSKNVEIKENLRTKLEKKLEKRWGEISATLAKYEEATKDRRKEYMILKAKDDADSKIIYQQMKKTQKLFEQLEVLKKCMDDCYAPKEMITHITDTREERTKFFNTFKHLKVILQHEVHQDEMNLKSLSAVTNSLTKSMKKTCQKGEQILTLYRICQSLETQHEKVLPVGEINFPKFSDGRKKKMKEKPPEKEPNENETIADHYVQDLLGLDKFWRKVAKARLSKLALQQCIKNMEKENKFLKQVLTSYFHEVTQKI